MIMYGIYANIYHQYTPNVSIYTSTMNPMGMEMHLISIFYSGASAVERPLLPSLLSCLAHPKAPVSGSLNLGKYCAKTWEV